MQTGLQSAQQSGPQTSKKNKPRVSSSAYSDIRLQDTDGLIGGQRLLKLNPAYTLELRILPSELSLADFLKLMKRSIARYLKVDLETITDDFLLGLGPYNGHIAYTRERLAKIRAASIYSHIVASLLLIAIQAGGQHPGLQREELETCLGTRRRFIIPD
jgi:hypothetical protein